MTTIATTDGDIYQIRKLSLELAVETVKNTGRFTTFSVVATANLYYQFLKDGFVPPQPQEVPEGTVDANI